MSQENTGDMQEQKVDPLLFWGCFAALIATSFGFILRIMVLGDWAEEFNLSETEKGQIFGVGLWPFAISIVLFSLIIDKIGYGKAMIFAFVCHILSAIITINATGYKSLWAGQFIVALANGTVEAVINPVVATMYAKHKTKWLNILHAGWPAGLVLGGLLTIMMGPEASWKIKIGLILIPTAIYAIMLFGRKFPIQERVTAGVSFKDMLSEAGAIGALIVIALMAFEIGGVVGSPLPVTLGIIGVLTVGYGVYVQSLGKPLFVFLIIIMMPLAITELGTDSWITDLMTPEMSKIGLSAGWIIVYTSFIMMLLRFFAGPIVHRLSPIGLLAACSLIAMVGLYSLSTFTGIMILVAATIYGVGKSFFWPTILGVVAEQFPKGGALTLNAIGGVGMLAVGIIGTPLLGYVQDNSIEASLLAYDKEKSTALHATYSEEKKGIFGKYMALDQEKLKGASEADTAAIATVTGEAKLGALRTVTLFPLFMFLCFMGLVFYFKSKGGYAAVDVTSSS